MKRGLLITILTAILLIGAFLLWYFFTKIHPLKVTDVIEVNSNNLVSYVGIGFEKEAKKFESLGELNPLFSPNSWRDNNNFIDDKKHPIMISVSYQEGPVPTQILDIVYDEDKAIQVYLPSLSGEGGPWAYFFVDKDGSTYWACATNKPCDTGTLSSRKSLKRSHLAKKAT